MTLCLEACLAVAWAATAPAQWCSPSALAVSRDGASLYVGCATRNRVEVLDTRRGEVVRSFPLPGPITALGLSADKSSLFAAVGGARANAHIIRLKAAGAAVNTAAATWHFCDRFRDEVAVFDAARRRELTRIRVVREPVAAALSPDGARLLVANSLPAGRADAPPVAAVISVLDTKRRALSGSIALPNGSTGTRDIRISPDGRTACVTHLLARYAAPATQIDRGWIETNAISLIDVARASLMGTVLLDEVDRGAANPWAIAWSADSRTLAVTHAGTHEVSLIDWPALLKKLAATAHDPADDLAFLVGIRRRIRLAGNGPRAIAVAGNRAYIAGYFSDTVEAIDLDAATPTPVMVARLSNVAETERRRGELLFNDGLLSFQGWLSCASCHGPDGRVDGLNWDLLNDGIGNPKNAKSLLLAHRTPPAMSQGVREDAEDAVRAGIRHILFAERPDRDAVAIDAYLRGLEPAPSPALVRGKLSAAARRGRELFGRADVGCAKCHPAGLFTDMKPYDVGTRAATDNTSIFDTPTLVEIWRTAPYLHDGSAATLREVLTVRNAGDRHGRTSGLSARQIDDLVAYLSSL
jgi:DNA-binding beta-propeller fold protein YncE